MRRVSREKARDLAIHGFLVSSVVMQRCTWRTNERTVLPLGTDLGSQVDKSFINRRIVDAWFPVAGIRRFWTSADS